jgi:D-alanyl-D-alanine carboxypeptidase
MTREILKPSGLKETTPDLPEPKPARFAHGHSLRLADGKRLVIPAEEPTNAVAAAGGYVATAGDVARFFASLAPNAARSVLTPASRRDMARRYHLDEEGAAPWAYGLGTISGGDAAWQWFGHSGSFQGTLSRTVIVPSQELTVSVMTNCLDGFANIFIEGILGILRVFAARGAPSAATRGWTGRYWSLWGAFELVPVKDRVLVAMPGAFAPLAAAPEIEPNGAATGMIVKGSGFGSVGEPARLVRDGKGRVKEFWLGGVKLLPRRAFEAEARARYGKKGRRR